MYAVEVWREGGWTLVGQYKTIQQAESIRDDYLRRGEQARIVRDGWWRRRVGNG